MQNRKLNPTLLHYSTKTKKARHIKFVQQNRFMTKKDEDALSGLIAGGLLGGLIAGPEGAAVGGLVGLLIGILGKK